MAKALSTWTVLPHGPLQRLSPTVATVTGDMKMPLTTLQRRMTVVALKDGGTVVYSPIALGAEAMTSLEALGRPAFLVVPNHFHRSDSFVWKQRYPEICVVGPSGAQKEIEEVVHVDTTSPDFGDPRVRFVVVPGMADKEAALEVRENGRLTLVLNDVIGHLPPSDGFVLRAMGFAGDAPQIPRMLRLGLLKDAKALRAQLETWASEPVERILVSHGRPIVDAPNEVLRTLARSL